MLQFAASESRASRPIPPRGLRARRSLPRGGPGAVRVGARRRPPPRREPGGPMACGSCWAVAAGASWRRPGFGSEVVSGPKRARILEAVGRRLVRSHRPSGRGLGSGRRRPGAQSTWPAAGALPQPSVAAVELPRSPRKVAAFAATAHPVAASAKAGMWILCCAWKAVGAVPGGCGTRQSRGIDVGMSYSIRFIVAGRFWAVLDSFSPLLIDKDAARTVNGRCSRRQSSAPAPNGCINLLIAHGPPFVVGCRPRLPRL